MKTSLFLLTTASLTLGALSSASAQTFEVQFSDNVGAHPRSDLVQGSDGGFYGTTQDGGASDYGSVFKVTSDGKRTVLYSFNGSNGRWPASGLVLGGDGAFYGTTNGGGSNNYGTVFRITPGGAHTVLYSFTGIHGSYPAAGLVHDGSGTFYGTTYSGGASDYGTVFKISDTGIHTVLHSFNGTNGSFPYYGRLVRASDGNFYGTASQGGNSDCGTVFKISPSGTINVLHSFNGTTGAYPVAGLVQGSDGDFYGTTYSGGAGGWGTVFKISASGTHALLHSLNSTDGSLPYGALVQGSDGDFYGTTLQGGGSDYGTVYKISTAGIHTLLHSFNGTNGSLPYAGLAQGSDGNFYGTTSQGGVGDFGTVFKISASGAHSLLHGFNGTSGRTPFSGLVQGDDGNFYGTTLEGGASDYGTVFKMSPGGTSTVLHSFSGTSGAHPAATLMQGSDGEFYGTTYSDGTNGFGTVFKINAGGLHNVLHFFNSAAGSYPWAGLIQGSDGAFYGTTYLGGPHDLGTFFKISAGGSHTELHTFHGSNGSHPQAGLALGSDGHFYGTASQGGANGHGTVFKVSPSGVHTILHSFDSSSGSSPKAGLVQGSDGDFYGTTQKGGPGNFGTVFKISVSGTHTVLHGFNYTDGCFPVAGLVQGSDGEFYGTTFSGGTDGFGTIFKISPSGTHTLLFSFDGSLAANPRCTPVFGTDGHLYGTAERMVVWRLNLGDPEISLSGNGQEIGNGDATPDLADHTDFGTIALNGGTQVRTFTLTNTGSADLTLTGTPKVQIGGANPGDFIVTMEPSSPIPGSGGTTTFEITFDPSAVGPRTATVSLANNDVDENPFTFALGGTGILSDNADLSALTISSATLSPAFASGMTGYTASVAFATTSITVTPTKAETNAAIAVRVNGGDFAPVTSGSPSGPLAMNVGNNTVDLLVTAEDTTTQKTYTITVTRDPQQVVNPGFEHSSTYSTAPNWFQNTWGDAVVVRGKETGIVHGGDASQRVEVTGLGTGGTLLKQLFTPIAGAVYEARIWMRGTPGQVVQFYLRQPTLNYRPGASRDIALTDSWQEYVIRGGFADPDGAEFVIQPKTPGTFYLDDASMVDVTAEELTIGPEAAAVIPAEYFGIHINKLGTHNVWPSLNQGLLRLWDTGTTWKHLQPTEETWNFSRLDYYLNHVTTHGPDSAVLHTLGVPPMWATGDTAPSPYYAGGSTAAPTDMENWRTYVRTVGERYAGRIKFYEIWNEWDYSGFFTGTVEQMVTMTRIAREELLAIDPGIRIVSPNITKGGLPKLDAFLAEGGGDHIDIIGYHFYSGTPEHQLGPFAGLRDVLSRYPAVAGKPVWNTEGASTTTGVDGDDRGRVARNHLFQWLRGMRQFSWYGWDITPGGLRLSATDTGSAVAPGGEAYREIQSWMVGARMASHEISPEGIWSVELLRDPGYGARAVWVADGTTQSYTVPPGMIPYRVRSIDGSVSGVNSATTLAATGNPVLIEPVASLLPLLTVKPATNVTTTTATIRGGVNPNGSTTTAQFEYGLTTAYGNTAAVSLSPADGNEVRNVSVNLTGLAGGVTYLYRLTATNAQGTAESASGSFTTPSDDANLSGLTLGSGTLVPAFASGTTSYTASASNATGAITVTPTRAQANASMEVRVNGGSYAPVTSGSPGGPFALNVGNNTIDIRVTAQAGNTKTYTVAVTRDKATQMITFADPGDQLTNATLNLSAAGGGSGNPVTFVVANGPASITDTVLSFTGAGSVTVTASQAGNSVYHPATPVARTFTVTKAGASVTLTNLDQTYNGSQRPAGATSDPPGKTVTFSYNGFATPPINAGTYEVRGSIDDPLYQGSATGTLVIAKATQAIIFANPGPHLANTTLSLSATGGASGNAIIFTAVGPALIDGGNVLRFTGPGSVTVRANQAGGANFEAAPEVAHTFEVTAATSVLTLSRLHQLADGTARNVAVATDPSDLEVEITYDGGSEAPTSPGIYQIVATSADARYEGTVSGTLEVEDPARSVVVPGGGLPALSALGDLIVPGYRIGAFEVTGSHWATVVTWAEANAGYEFEGAASATSGDRPVTEVSWHEAAKWCNARTEWENAALGRSVAPAYRLGGVTFKTGAPAAPGDLVCDFGTSGYRLPTAAEWEFAARGGAGGVVSIYPGGDSLDDLGWYAGNSHGTTQPGGGKAPNGLDLHDLAGNGSEWTWDGPSGNAAQRYLRGGSWSSAASSCELSELIGETAASRFDHSGFRSARSVSLALAAAVDQPQLEWESGGGEPWFAQTGSTFDGEDSAESGAVSQGRTSWMETLVEGPGNLRFRWKTNGVQGVDSLTLSVDSTTLQTLSGPGDWEERVVEIGAGTHILRWSLLQGSPTGSATAWVDAVTYETASPPTVTTASPTEVSATSATLGGEVTGDGGREITLRGVVYATSTEPALDNGSELPAIAGGTGSFTVSGTSLLEGTTYHARAYAVNDLGTSYGPEVVFTTRASVVLVADLAALAREILAGDRHVFDVNLAEARFVTFTTTGEAPLRATLRNAAGDIVAVFSGDANFTLTELLEAGDYSLEILRNPGEGDALPYSLAIDATILATVKPDLAVGATASGLIGRGIFPPTGQVAGLISRKVRPVTGYLEISNRGTRSDRVRVASGRGSGFFGVAYFGASGNVTAACIRGAYETPALDATGAPDNLRVVITPNKKKLAKKVRGRTTILKKTMALTARATSTHDPAIHDAAMIRTQTR